MKKVCVWNEEREQKDGSTCAAWSNEVPRFWYDISTEFVSVKVPLHVTVPAARLRRKIRSSTFARISETRKLPAVTEARGRFHMPVNPTVIISVPEPVVPQ